MTLNPSHVPRLVYDFLSKSGCQKAAEQYADECPYLTGLKYFTETSGNTTLPPMIGPSLLEIIDKFYSTQTALTQDESTPKPCEKSNSVKGSKCASLESEGKVLSTTLMPETAAPQPNTQKPSSTLNVETRTHQSNIVIAAPPRPPISAVEKNNRPVRPIAPKPSKLLNQAPTTPSVVFPNSPSNSSMTEFLKKLDPILPIPASQILLVSEALAQDPDIPLELISILTEDYLGPRAPTGVVWMTIVGAGTKCWTFLSVLLRLSKQPGCRDSDGVRVLVDGLLHGIIDVTGFVTALQRLYNVQRISRSLIPFLTAVIPHLCQFMMKNKISIDGIKYSPVKTVNRGASVPAPVSTTGQFSAPSITEQQGCLLSVQSVKPVQRSTDPIPIGTIPPTPQAIDKFKKPSQITTVEISKAIRDVPLLIALQNLIQSPVTNQLNLTGTSAPLSENENLNLKSTHPSLLQNNNSSTSSNLSTAAAPVVIKMSCEEARSKCFHYLNYILRLSPKKPKKGHHSVRALVQKLIDDEIEPEAFVKIVVAVPDIAPTGSQLVSFLKEALPHFRKALYSNELALEGITPPSDRLVSSPTAQSPPSVCKKEAAAETQETQDSNQKQNELNSSEHETAQFVGSPTPFTPSKCIPGASESTAQSEMKCDPDSFCGPNEGTTSSNDSLDSGTLTATTDSRRASSDSSTDFLPKLLALKRIASDMLSNSRNANPCHTPPPTKRNRPETRPCSVVLRRAFDLRMPQGTFSISM